MNTPDRYPKSMSRRVQAVRYAWQTERSWDEAERTVEELIERCPPPGKPTLREVSAKESEARKQRDAERMGGQRR